MKTNKVMWVLAVLVLAGAVLGMVLNPRFWRKTEPASVAKASAGKLAERVQELGSESADSEPPIEGEPTLSTSEGSALLVKPAIIPVSLSRVMGTDAKNDYMSRLQGVHALGNNLRDEEINALYVLLNRKAGEDSLPQDKLNALKNDVVNILRGQQRKPAKLAQTLVSMYSDKTHDDVWRDYCIQHLGGWCVNIEDSVEKEAAVATLWKAAEENDKSTGGTALIALVSNAGALGVDSARIADTALRFCEDPACGDSTKMTALQICAKLNDRRVLPAARRIAGSGSIVPLRMSAIAALGTLGDESDRPMLTKYVSSTDTRLRKSAHSALARLSR